MKYMLKISPKAHEDIASIYDYIKKDGLDIAKNQVDNIYDSISSLQEFPNIGKRLDNYLDIQTDYLYLVIKKLYIAFYLLKDKEIHVIRILSCKQDYLKILELV